MPTRPVLRHGDIFATQGTGPVIWLSRKLTRPSTDRGHFGLIADYAPWERNGRGDYVILESLSGWGVVVGRLSQYAHTEIEIYRPRLNLPPADDEWLRRRACTEASRLGRSRYEYLFVFKLLLGALTLLLRGKLPPWRAAELPYVRNSRLACTEVVNEGWRGAGCPIVPPGVAPIPSAFREALDGGRISLIYKGIMEETDGR